MPRPKKIRLVSGYPKISAFVPKGTPATGEILLPIEGLEAIRLSDFESMDQDFASKLMEVSRQTYGRILFEARHTIASALITGKALKIKGRMYEFHGHHGRRRRRRGGGRRFPE